jgi:hypothetical protein
MYKNQGHRQEWQ